MTKTLKTSTGTGKKSVIRNYIVMLIAIVLIATACVCGMFYLLRGVDSGSSRLSELSETAASSAAISAPEAPADSTDSLEAAAAGRAGLIDGKLAEIETMVEELSATATAITDNPGDYSKSVVNPPTSANDGKAASQLIYAENSVRFKTATEIGLIGNIQDFAISMLESDETILAVQLGSESGFCILTDRESSSKSEYLDIRTRPWYAAAKEQDALVWTDVFDDAFGRGKAVTCGMPYYKGGNIRGVVSVGMLVSSLSDSLVNLQGEDPGRIVLLLDSGLNVVLSSDSGSEHFKAGDAFGAMVPADGAGAGEYWLGETRLDLAYSHLSEVPWTVVCMEEASEPVIQGTVETPVDISGDIDEMADGLKTSVYYVFGLIFALLLLSLIVVTIITVVSVRKLRKRTAGRPAIKLQMKDHITNMKEGAADKENAEPALSVANVFPTMPPECKEVDVQALMKPDGEAGGNFCDFFMIGGDTFCVLVAKVPGEGMPATLFKLSARTMIRDHARMGLSPAEVFTKVNDLLREGNDAGMTVTAFMACLNVRTGRLTYVNAGHSVQYARRGSESYRPIICDTGMPLAASQGEQFIQGEMEFAPGDMLYLCTDGNLLGEGGMLSLEFICKPLP